MADILVSWSTLQFRGDWTVTNGSLTVDAGLQTAVLISLFSDRVASPDYVSPDGSTDRRGWWADAFEPSPIGSRLWQLNRAKKTDSKLLLAQAKDIVSEALQWLVQDGVASAVNVSTAWDPQNAQTMNIGVTIIKPNGRAFRYAFAWGDTVSALPAPYMAA